MKKNKPDNLLLQFRAEAGLTQKETADLFGVDIATIQRREASSLSVVWQKAVMQVARERRVKLP